MTDQRDISQLIIDSLSSGLFLLDIDYSIRYLNESAEELIQCSVKRVVGLPLVNFIKHADNTSVENRLVCACQKSRESGLQVWMHAIEVSLPHALQTRQVNCLIKPVEIDETVMILLEVLPVELSNIKNFTADWPGSNQMVVRGLAHEIRNPLGGIRGAAQLLENELANKRIAGELTQYTEIIIREADRLSKLVGDMQVSISLKNKEQINIHRILEHVRNLIQSDTTSFLNIVPDYDPSLPEVLGDEDQLTQAFINLLNNAVESMEIREANGGEGSSGLIGIRSRIDHQILPEVDYSQQVVRIDICDDGVGISPDLIDHIFKPMVSDKISGTGLGLSITSEIIRNHGGLITAQSNLDETVFSVYLKTVGNGNGK